MATEKRLIDANALMDTVEGANWYHIDKLGYLANGANSQDHTPIYKADDIYNAIRNAPTVDAVEVMRIEEVKKEILKIIDEFIAEYRHISQSYVDHFGGKADAMETARRLVNAALTDLCSHGERREGE